MGEESVGSPARMIEDRYAEDANPMNVGHPTYTDLPPIPRKGGRGKFAFLILGAVLVAAVVIALFLKFVI